MKALERAMRTRNIWVATITELKRILNNKPKFITYILGGPVILATIVGFVAHQAPEAIQVGVFINQSFESQTVANRSISQLIHDIDGSNTFSVVEVPSPEEGLRRLYDEDTRAFITFNEGKSGLESVDVLIDIADPLIQQTIQNELQNFLNNYSEDVSLRLMNIEGIASEKAHEILSPFNVESRTNARRNVNFFDSYASGFIILVVLGFSLFYSSTAITSERSSGTIERVFASPYGKLEIIAGKLFAQSVFAIMAAILCTVTLGVVHHMVLGNIFLVFLTAGLVGINGVIIGLVISSFCNDEAQSMLVAIIAFIGFIMLMTFLWPFETMHPVARYISQGIPFTYAMDAIRRLNLLGAGLNDVWQDLTILAGSIFVLAAAATIILRREIK